MIVVNDVAELCLDIRRHVLFNLLMHLPDKGVLLPLRHVDTYLLLIKVLVQRLNDTVDELVSFPLRLLYLGSVLSQQCSLLRWVLLLQLLKLVL